MIDRLIDHAERLIELPRTGRVVPEVGHPDIRELLIDNYRLVYRIRANKIEVLQVFEGHRLPRELP